MDYLPYIIGGAVVGSLLMHLYLRRYRGMTHVTHTDLNTGKTKRYWVKL